MRLLRGSPPAPEPRSSFVPLKVAHASSGRCNHLPCPKAKKKEGKQRRMETTEASPSREIGMFWLKTPFSRVRGEEGS